MSSTALYKAFIEVGASEDSATKAAEESYKCHSYRNWRQRPIWWLQKPI